MGFKVPEVTANSKAPLAAGEWNMDFKKFTSGVSSVQKTPYVQAVFTLDPEEEAVDADGEDWGKRQFFGETFYLTDKAMWRLKKFASNAEVEIPEAGEEFDSLKEYAAALTDAFEGVSVTVNTVIEKFYSEKNGDTDPDDEDTWTGRKATVNDLDDYVF